jgi:molybdenum cofactor cytidylyltransferase
MSSPNYAILRKTSVAILAAGFSSRMGRDKALLKFDKDQNFIQKIISTYYKAGICDVHVVVNPENSEAIKSCLKNHEAFPVKFSLNKEPERGRFSSICEGVAWIPTDNHCFVQDCDNPFITETVISKLIDEFDADYAMVPAYKRKKGHPVLLSTDMCLALMFNMREFDDFKSFLDHIPVKTVEVEDDSILRNINTMDDYLSLYSKNNETT